MRAASKGKGAASPALIVSVVALLASLGGTAIAGSGTSLPDRWKFPEAYHAVGAPGEPGFGNGGEGDCVWGNASGQVDVDGLNPAAFYRDPLGRVHLAGVVAAHSDAGGDGSCGGGEPLGDLVVFVLPPEYRPENVELPGRVVVVGEGGAEIDGSAVPAGAVIAVGGFGPLMLDGLDFRAAGPQTRPIGTGDPVVADSLKDLRALAN